MPQSNTELTVQELKTIIHALRMSTLSFVEEDAIDEIQSMIKALPLPEEVDRISVHTPLSIKNLQKDVGNIMRLIELYGKRDVEFKTRYISRTGLPPRYRVLDWRKKQMRPEVKASIREMVKISSDLDNKGYGEISGHINKFASKIVKDEFDSVEYEKIVIAMKKAGLEKEAAGFMDYMGGMARGMGGKIKEMAIDIWQAGQKEGLEAQYGALYQQIVKFKNKVDDLAKKTERSNPEISQQMRALSQAINVGGTQINQGVQKAKSRAQKAPAGQQAARQKVPAGFQITPDIEKQLLSMGWQKPATVPQPASTAPATV